jgi:hypothetical protein
MWLLPRPRSFRTQTLQVASRNASTRGGSLAAAHRVALALREGGVDGHGFPAPELGMQSYLCRAWNAAHSRAHLYGLHPRLRARLVPHWPMGPGPGPCHPRLDGSPSLPRVAPVCPGCTVGLGSRLPQPPGAARRPGPRTATNARAPSCPSCCSCFAFPTLQHLGHCSLAPDRNRPCRTWSCFSPPRAWKQRGPRAPCLKAELQREPVA